MFVLVLLKKQLTHNKCRNIIKIRKLEWIGYIYYKTVINIIVTATIIIRILKSIDEAYSGNIDSK